jgi:hypothetical protein
MELEKTKIIFFNNFHIGDTYFSQPFVKNIVDNNAFNYDFYFFIQYNSIIYVDLITKIKDLRDNSILLDKLNNKYKLNSTNHLNGINKEFFIYDKELNVFLVNTWLGKLSQLANCIECNSFCYIEIFQRLVLKLNDYLKYPLIYAVNINNCIPSFPEVDINLFLDFKNNNKDKKIIFINNYKAFSGQKITLKNDNDYYILGELFCINNFIVIFSEKNELGKIKEKYPNNIFFVNDEFNLIQDYTCHNLYISMTISYNCDYSLYFDTGRNFTYINEKFIKLNNLNKRYHIATTPGYFNNLNDEKIVPKDYIKFIKAQNIYELIMILKDELKIQVKDQENFCEYVCSRGLLKSCDVQSSTPISSIRELVNYDFSTLRPGSTIYVCGSAVPHFVQVLAPQIPFGYILVSGDCYKTVPNDLFLSEQDFNNFINLPNLIHWFSQNCVIISHPKISQIPIGIDYHTLAECHRDWGSQTTPLNQEKLLKAVISKAKPLDQRICQAYANFQFLMTNKLSLDCIETINQVQKDLIFYETTKTKRLNTWVNQSKYAFVISPYSNGLDCCITWEALALGCILIIKTSPLDLLFNDLPVLIVNSWSDITQELLDNTIQEYSSKQFKTEKLKLNYWINKIQSIKYI